MKIRELLNESRKFTIYANARDINNREVFLQDSDAVCWCLLGAIFKCYGGDEQFSKIYSKILENLPAQYNDITTFSDKEGYKAVKALIDKLDI